MSEQAPEGTGTNTESAEQTPPEGAEQEPKTFDAEYVANLRKEAAKYRTEAKSATAELEKQRQASMTEAEKAVVEAEARGRTAAASEFGKRLARTEFDAAAGRRNPNFDTAAALEFVDLSRFLDESGEPDPKAIKAAVERLVPNGDTGPATFDGGARSTSKSSDFNQILRTAVGR